jgi:hypothetical protein
MEGDEPARQIQMMLAQATMPSKLSQSAMVAQGRSKGTSASENTTREGPRPSSNRENSLRRPATRDRGISSSNIIPTSAYHPESKAYRGKHCQVSIQNRPRKPVNLSAKPWCSGSCRS